MSSINYSTVDSFNLEMRGSRSATFKLSPQNGEVIDPNTVKVNIGLTKDSLFKSLTLNNGITDNGDGTFDVVISPNDFERTNVAYFEVYGLQNLPTIEIAIGQINYVKGMQ